MNAEDQSAEQCLAGGGEAGALMRAIDWANNPIGPVASWPPSLRTLVSVMLASRFAMRVMWGPELILLYNDAYQPVLGPIKHPGAMGSRTADSFAEVWSIVGPLFERVQAGESVALENTLLSLYRDGYLEECFFTLSYSPIREEDGRIGGVMGVVHETTDQVLAERRLNMLRELAARAASAATAEQACHDAAAALWQNPADVPFALLYLVEPDHQQARLAAAAGIERGGRASPELHPLDPAHEGAWPLALAAGERRNVEVGGLGDRFGALHAGPYPEPLQGALVLPLLRPGMDHPYGFLVAGVSPRRALDGRYRELFELAAGHIVTALSNAAALQEQQRRVEALAEIDRAKTAFFSNVSHEFRTPLTLMLGPLEDALGSPEQALTGKNLHTALRNAQRLRKLVNTLLDFSRLEAGRVKARYQETDLAAFTRELASAFESLFEKAGLTLAIDCPPLAGRAWVDREMWEKIVLNLVSNAFKFTFEGGIQVALAESDGFVELAVSDTGTGIPAAELPRLFERFHRVEGARSRTYEGSGIGLALVSELARLHGATVRVTSALDRGTTFVVRMPLGAGHLPPDRLATTGAAPPATEGAAPFVQQAARWIDPARHASAALATDLAGDLAGDLTGDLPLDPLAAGAPRVLLADDNADMREYIRGLLERHFVVEVAADGLAALEAARARVPDLVLADVMMPRLDGFGLLHALRAEPLMRGVPVILLSARAGEESRVEGIEAGADDYLVKPFSARELVARVRAHIELGRLRARLEAERRAAIELERRRLYALFMQSPAGICVLRGPDHVYELANAPYIALVGGRQVVGRPLRLALPELADVVVPLLDRVYLTGEPFFGNEVPLLVERAGRIEERFFNFAYQPIVEGVEGDPQITGIAVLAFEVSDQVLARRRAERLFSALQETNRDLDRFAYVASHDLKAPLRAIANLSQWIEEDLGDKIDDPARQKMNLLRGRVRRLEALIDGILSYSRAGRTQETVETVDVAALLSEIRDLLSPVPPARITIGPRMPTFETERVPLQQVLMNLCSNALKHARRPDVEVTVTCAPTADGYHFAVADNGPGIPAQYHERIWNIFTTLEARDKVEGTGIGLSIVKKIVEARGGRVSIESPEGGGAVFHVYWPRVGRVVV